MPVPGSVVTRAHDSTSGPYTALLRQAVHVVVFVDASWFDVTRRPVSAEPMMPFDQRPASDSAFSFLLKLSTTGKGSTGGRIGAIGVALASFESELTPTAFEATTL